MVRLSDAVAVVADHTGAARKGLAALRITWDPGPNGGLTSAELERRIDAAMAGEEMLVAHQSGDVAAAGLQQAPAGSMPCTACRSSLTPPWSR